MSEQETREYLTRIEMIDEYLNEDDDLIDLEIAVELASRRVVRFE